MNAVDLLVSDHNEVRGLFERFKAAQEAEDADEMSRLATAIFEELEVHTTIEEEIFYPAVRDESEDLAEVVDEGIQEHHVVDVLMNELRDTEDGSDEWVAKMTVLIENVEHHAEEEEKELFPDVREELGDDRLSELGGELEARKAALEAGAATKDELYAKAKDLGVEGRSDMTKDELASAVTDAPS
jgi:hemerythrin superfamily protein